jgi:hypothetical protein
LYQLCRFRGVLKKCNPSAMHIFDLYN